MSSYTVLIDSLKSQEPHIDKINSINCDFYFSYNRNPRNLLAKFVYVYPTFKVG